MESLTGKEELYITKANISIKEMLKIPGLQVLVGSKISNKIMSMMGTGKIPG